MKNIEEINLKNRELGKLIEYAYYLREEDYKEVFFPTYQFYDGSGMLYGTKTEKGGISVWHYYPDHSSCDVLTSICIFEGSEENPQRAYYLSTSTENYDFWIETVKLTKYKGHFETDKCYFELKKEEVIKYFIDAMMMLGFKEEDVIKVLKQEIPAQEAFRNIARDEIKNRTWVTKDRRIFVFDKNIAVKGDFSGMWLYDFPFPFTEAPIFDCSKVKCASTYFEDNPRKIKLINVNQNPESILFTDLTNVEIDEVIDLSKVNATSTTFGHHKVINLDKSIASLDSVNLALATDEEGNNYITDEDGIVNQEFRTDNFIERKTNNIAVYADADNGRMALDAMEHDAEGIGLIRSEDIFTKEQDALKRFIPYIVGTYAFEPIDYNSEFNQLQYRQLKEICSMTSQQSKKIIRLFDFKEEDIKRAIGDETDEGERLKRHNFLQNHSGILRDQIFTIAKISQEENTTFDILVPLVTDERYFMHMKSDIISYGKEAGIDSMKVGAMIEDKSALSQISKIAKHADFISIGTNDLTESVEDKKRSINDKDFIHLTDSVKQAIEEIIYQARAVNPNIRIGICGEHANYIDNIKYYSTLNIDYITCSPSFIEANKNIVNQVQKIKKPG